MSRRRLLPAALAAAVLLSAAPVLAQAGAGHGTGHEAHGAHHAADKKAADKKAADTHAADKHAAKGEGKAEAHGKSAWAALDAYHALMMATWHPAKEKSDLAPLRAKAAAMVTSAKALAASTAPASCRTPAIATAATDLVPATEGVAALVTRNATDAELKTALGALHDQFEVLEHGCSAKH